MKTLIVSDMHFKFALQNPEDSENNRAVLSFLKDSVGKYDLLVLNGDIFDLWFDWKYTIIKQHFPLLKILADIQEAGCEIVYISGNHDFWFNDFFTNIMKVKLCSDSYEYHEAGEKILVSHGDLYTVNDLRYKIFRRLIRMRVIKQLFSLLHPDFALELGKTLSRSSRMRRITRTDRELKLKGLEDFATRMIKTAGYACVVLGHSHEPLLKKIAHASRLGEKPENYGYYVNCGDWVRHYSYVIVVDGIPQLHIFAQNEQLKEKS